MVFVASGAGAPAWAKKPKLAHVISLGGHGTRDAVIVRGRALEGKPSSGARGGGRVRKLFSTAHAFMRDELEHVDIVVTDAEGHTVASVRTDDEGFFTARVPGPWPAGRLRLFVALGPGKYHSERVLVEVLVPDDKAGAGYVVVTDLDDTVVVTHAHQGKAALVATQALQNADDMRPIAGAAQTLAKFYQSGTPVVYVSAGPVELAPRTRAFLSENGFPPGALFFRHYEDDGIGKPVSYKLARIEAVMADFPGRKFILIGDNGESDPDIFARLAKKHARVVAAYVRREVRGKPDPARPAQITEFASWHELYIDAHRRGWLP